MTNVTFVGNVAYILTTERILKGLVAPKTIIC